MSPEELVESQTRFAKNAVKPLYVLFGLLALMTWRTGSFFGIPAVALPAIFVLGLPILSIRVVVDAVRTGMICTWSGVISRKTEPTSYVMHLTLLAAINLLAIFALVFLVVYSRTHPGWA